MCVRVRVCVCVFEHAITMTIELTELTELIMTCENFFCRGAGIIASRLGEANIYFGTRISIKE